MLILYLDQLQNHFVYARFRAHDRALFWILKRTTLSSKFALVYFGIIDHCWPELTISVLLRQRRHQIDRYMSPRLVVTRSKRKKYSSYPDIEYAAAKRTKQNSNNSNQENHPNQEEVREIIGAVLSLVLSFLGYIQYVRLLVNSQPNSTPDRLFFMDSH